MGSEIERLRRFSYIEGGPPADLAIEAYGSTIGEAFANAALAMFNAMTPLEQVEERESWKVEVRDSDLGGLLFNFLDELLFVHETENLIFSGMDVHLDEEMLQLTADCRGELFDTQRHESGIVVKAVTFHQMKIERGEEGWVVRVVLDT